ncbi:hypothetical protein SLY17_003538 [Cronobacter dublinensis]|nr:hypothetical protein [Cronobacter dublinensis]
MVFTQGLRALFGLALAGLTLSASAAMTPQDERDASALIARWNDFKNHPTAQAGASLYGEQVSWYGKALAPTAVIAENTAFLQKHPHYTQRIVSNITFTEQDGQPLAVQATFVKQAGLEVQTPRNYPAQLTLTKQAAAWRISEETDWITEANRQKMRDYRLAGGRFNGTAKSYAWLTAHDPKTNGVCDESGDCECQLWNSDPTVKPASIASCIGGGVEALSNLDDSGRDRVLIYPEWWSSAWRATYLYDVQQQQWVEAIPSFSMNLNVQEDVEGKTLVARDPQHPGQVIVAEAKWDEKTEDIVISKSAQPLKVLK